ncbi:hypothetical protein CPB86DRAFT_120641 [Serendipita vermifera]|nr:hypothetical protein CPB86DRAFT_120641 [Serendipita vermifera]
MNITVDDTSPNFVWSGGDVWRGQAPNQAALNDKYFLRTYHAAQTKGANVSITFVGSTIQIYGSKGPNHGNYSVTFDSAIRFMPGFAEEFAYQQLLFSHSFGTTFETHTVILQNEEDLWMDLDFMVLTISTTADTSTSDIGFFTSTVSPAAGVPSSSSSSTGSDESSASSSNNGIFKTLTFALAAVVGVLIIAGIVICLLLRRRSRAHGRSDDGKLTEQRFSHAPKGLPSSATDDPQTQDARRSTLLAFGRHNVGRGGGGLENASLVQTPMSGSMMTTDQSPLVHRNAGGGRSHDVNGGADARNSRMGGGVNSTNRDSFIALNNMAKRPGYRNLASDSGSSAGHRPTGSNSASAALDGRETPISMNTLGSAGQTWVGASKLGLGRSRQGSTSGLQNESIDAQLSTMSVANLQANRAAYGNVHHNMGHLRGDSDLSRRTQGRDDEYTSVGIGLGIYASNSRADSEQRLADLKRSASVASSGIVDRMTSSPPPAVPELPPLSSTAGSMMSSLRAPIAHSQGRSPTSSIYSQSDAYGATANKLRPPYMKSELSLTSSSGSTGTLPLRPPPVRTQTDDRGTRERNEKAREAAREQEMSNREHERYSHPPPEYAPNASPIGGADLQRQGTRTGDIPIGIEGGFGNADYETESQESHSVFHATVQTAQHVPALPPISHDIIYRNSQAPSTTSFTQTSTYSQSSQATSVPQLRSQHSRDNSQMGSGSTAMKAGARAITPDNARSYTPDRSMAIGRPSEDRVWTLDGVSNADRVRSPLSHAANVGVAIIDDRARLAATSGNARTLPGRRISRVPAPHS